MHSLRGPACFLAIAFAAVSCAADAGLLAPRPVASIGRDAGVTARERSVALAVSRCFPVRERARLRYAKAAFENGGPPVFVVFLGGAGNTAVKSLNNDVYYDRSRGVIFATPAEPAVFADAAERRLHECLTRARDAGR